MRFSAITSAAVATQVWAAATRNLTNPSGVFSDATRNLTGLGAGAMAMISVIRSTLAASTALNVQPAALKFRELSVLLIAGAAGTLVANLYDGTSITSIVSAAAGGLAGGQIQSTNGLYLRLVNNDGTNSSTYSYAGVEWGQ